ncbi:MAG: deoxynucleoside kinase [Chloroflexota bacterium]|nr:deoxynucleoside kinase [Chloroflexota bacterium]MBI5702862.1 deoxynucleoside kinase [Chloroflexota bacterium]
MNKLVVVVGSSGVGKTSLVQALARTGLFQTALEQHAERPFQAMAKEDSRYLFANQMDYLLLRAEQERELRAASKTGLMDGGLDLDFHGFTRLFLRRNLLSQKEFDLCRRFYAFARACLPPPELIVRLRADEETVTGRMSRRKRINLARAEDTALFESFLDEWLAGVSPHQVLELNVAHETLDYNQSVQAVLERTTQLRGETDVHH